MKARVIKVKTLSVPPVNQNPVGLTEEAFENLREWRLSHGQEICQEDLKWYYAELEEDKKKMETYLTENPSYKAMIDSVAQGFSDEQREAATAEAKKKEPVSDDLGPMPEYGSKEFWAWCRKRKEIRLKKEAAIIAAGGTVPAPKKKK